MIFLGAGASSPFGIPTSRIFTDRIRELIKIESEELLTSFDEYYMKVNKREPDFETYLTLLKAYSTPHEISQEHFTQYFAKSHEEFNKNYSKIIKELYNLVDYSCCAPFNENCEEFIPPSELELIFNNTYDALFGNIMSKKRQALVFTTNYDPSIELWCQKRNLFCHDGSVPTNNPEIRIHHQNIQAHFHEINNTNPPNIVRTMNLIRLHGSVWTRVRDSGELFKFNRPKDSRVFSDIYEKYSNKEPLLIFPGEEDKLRLGRWDEYYQFFKDNLKGNCLFIGYSFRHSVINEQVRNNLENGKITKLGILSPDPLKLITNLFPRGDHPQEKIIKIPGYFGKKEVLNNIGQHWFNNYIRATLTQSQVIRDGINWKKEREREYVR